MAAKSSKTKYTSKGERPNVNKSVLKSASKDVTFLDKLINVRRVWRLNKTDPWVTIDNPNKLETAKKFIKVKAKTLWGDPRKQKYSMGNSKEVADV